ncbi:MAG: glycosyltransferase [Planctomycetota bacterium]
MRILIVAGTLTYSNMSTYTLQLIRGLKARGHEVQVAALGGPLFPKIEAFGVQSFLVKFNYFSYRKLLQFLREFNPEIIHATGGGRALLSATRFARQMWVPLIHTVHSWLPKDRGKRLPNQVRGVMAVNEDLREHLVNELNVPKGMIKVIPYGIDSELSTGEASPAPPNHIPVVGTIGRLERGRRHHEFLAAARLIRDRVENVHFMIAGEGPNEPRLRNQTKELKLADCVTFVQPQKNFHEIYSAINILVIVSDWGGVGLNLLEGMARGCPVIATGGGRCSRSWGRRGFVCWCRLETRSDSPSRFVSCSRMPIGAGSSPTMHGITSTRITRCTNRSCGWKTIIIRWSPRWE